MASLSPIVLKIIVIGAKKTAKNIVQTIHIAACSIPAMGIVGVIGRVARACYQLAIGVLPIKHFSPYPIKLSRGYIYDSVL